MHGKGEGDPRAVGVQDYLGHPERLRALDYFGLLDTPPESRFDRITALAVELFEVPIAFVSLVADTRQFFKSEIGLNSRGTPIEHSTCAIAIRESLDFLVIEDMGRVQRVCNFPAVTGEQGLRFYAGVTLQVEGGHRIGTLCISDTRPRTLDARDRRLLSYLAQITVDEIRLTRAQAELAGRERQAAELTRTRSQFLASMGHELRSPLCSIVGYAELIADNPGASSAGHFGQPAGPSDETREYAHTIQDYGRDLISLVDNILDLARAEANDLDVDIERSDVAACVRRVVSSMAAQANAKGVRLTGGEIREEMVWPVDIRRFRQIATNLVANAIKDCRTGGQARVDIAVRPGQRLRLAVIDDGIGMTRSQVRRAFLAFVRHDEKARDAGYGLGLTLVRQLAERHGGRVRVRSEKGKGTAVIVSLPDLLPDYPV